MVSHILYSLLIAGMGATTPFFSFDLGLSGSYDSNLNNTETELERQGGAAGTSWLSGAVDFDLSKNLTTGLDIGWSGSFYPSYKELSNHSLVAEALLLWESSWPISVRTSVHAGGNQYVDESMDSLLAGTTFSLRFNLTEKWSLVSFLQLNSRWARDPALTGLRINSSGQIEFDIYKNGWIIAGYLYGDGPPTLYRTISGSNKNSPGETGPLSGKGSLHADRLIAHVFFGELRLGIENGLYLFVGYDFSWMLPLSSSAYPIHIFNTGLGWGP